MIEQNDIKKMEDILSNLRIDLAIKKDRLDKLKNEKDEIEKKIEDLNIDLSEKTSIALQKLSSAQRELAKERLEELGTQALKFSMGDKYRMIISLDPNSKKKIAEVFVLDENTGIKTKPLSDNGGGIVDIMSIALRIVVLQSIVPVVEGPIILDEPFKMVSKEYVPLLSNFLLKVCKDFDRQIIVVTHNQFLAENCDNKIIIE